MTDTTQSDATLTQAPRTNDPPTIIYTTHPKVVVGVVLISSLMLFSVVFSVAVLIIRMTGNTDDLSPISLLFAAGISLFLTAVFWMSVEDEKK